MIRRAVSAMLVIFMIISVMPLSALADDGGVSAKVTSQFSDMPDDWSSKALQNAVANGLLNGENGKIMPFDNLTRAQMATVIVRAFGAATKGDLSGYSDIKSDDWFAESMAKAFKMGIIKGSDGKMNPDSAITRQEVFVILARALKMKPESSITNIFSDVNEIAAWAVGEVYAFVNAGYIKGSEGRLNPKALITRAEFAQILENIIKLYINKAGDVVEVQDGNIMVNTPGVTLKNLKVNGDLIIGDGVGDGEFIMENVEITGRLVVRGGGKNSIIIRGNSHAPNVVVARVDGVVSVKVQGEAKVDVIYIDDGSDNVNVEGAIGNITVTASDILVTAVGATIGTFDIAG